MTFGHSSVSYEVALPNRALIVRTNANPEVFARTARNLSVLRELGLPVSKPIVSDVTRTRYPAAYMILEKIPGRDLRYELGTMTPVQKRRLAEQIVGYQRATATLPEGNGFGYAAIGEKAPFSSWRDLVVWETRSNLPDNLEPPWQGYETAFLGSRTPSRRISSRSRRHAFSMTSPPKTSSSNMANSGV